MDFRQQSVATKPRARSAITNGSKLFEHKPTRERSQRRFRDLLEAYTEEYEVVSEADQSLIRMAAGLTLKAEQLQAALVRGENVREDALIRLTGTAHRVLSTLKRRASADAPTAPSFHDYFADVSTVHDNEEGDA